MKTSSLVLTQAEAPTAFPAPGTFHVTQRVTLLSSTPSATIRYTTNGSTPTAVSPIFDQYKLPVLDAINVGDVGQKTSYVIKAIATQKGTADSDVVTFDYTIDRRSKDVYLARDISSGLRMVIDFDDTKMVLITGSQRALLIDAGLGGGDLCGYVELLIGDLPLDVAITHAHPDHVACMAQFQGTYNVYMHHADLPLVRRFNEQMGLGIDTEKVIDLREGFVFDLGDQQLTVYEVPGHTPGSIVLFDEATGDLFAGDALGSSRPTIVDALWMQHKGMAPIDEYLSTVQGFRAKLRGKIRRIFTGHNDVPIYGETYLDNLQQAAQHLVDEGDAVLTPSLRPTDVWQVVVGDRMTDPNWIAINVRKGQFLTALPHRLATLSHLHLSLGTLTTAFKPSIFMYSTVVASDETTIEVTPTATSTRYRALSMNGTAVVSGTACRMSLNPGENEFMITVTSPDGSAVNNYKLNVTRLA